MSSSSEFGLGSLFGVIGVTIVFVVVATAGDIGSPHEHYQQNVCLYLNGQMHDDICVVNQKVIDIPQKEK